MAAGEALLFFGQGDGADYRRAVASFPFHRKGTGHMIAKHRFITAPFAKTLGDGSWLTHAAHANAMGRRLAQGLAALGCPPRYPAQANGVFVSFTEPQHAALAEAGFGYYQFGDAALNMSRLMCSFDTTPEDVDGFLRIVEACQAGAG